MRFNTKNLVIISPRGRVINKKLKSISASEPKSNLVQSNCTAYADSAATGHYFASNDTKHLINVNDTLDPVSVSLPDGQQIQSSHTASINWPQLPIDAVMGDIIPGFTRSLISIPRLCDTGHTAVLNSEGVTILDSSGRTAMTGGRDAKTGLFILPLSDPSIKVSHTANASIYAQSSAAKRVAFYSSVMGNPADSTMQAAIDRGFLSSFPGLTSELFKRYKPNSVASAKGHLNRLRKGIRSTAVTPIDITVQQLSCDDVADDLPDLHPAERTLLTPRIRTAVFTRRYEIPALHCDATGALPVEALLAIVRLETTYILPLCPRHLQTHTLRHTQKSWNSSVLEASYLKSFEWTIKHRPN